MKPYINFNRPTKKAKNDFEYFFFCVFSFFGKTMENVRKYRDTKPVITE